MPQIDVIFGEVTISMTDAIALYNSLRHDPERDDAMQSEIVALWNAIQRADKKAKGIPLTRLPFNPKTEAAVARLVARLEQA